MAELTPKQQRFVELYLVDQNGTAAARGAGYSEKQAPKYASELLSKPHIRAAIDAATAERSERTKVTQDMVIQGLLQEAREGDSNSARVSAWGLLGKHLGMFVDRTEHSGAMGVRFEINLGGKPNTKEKP